MSEENQHFVALLHSNKFRPCDHVLEPTSLTAIARIHILIVTVL